MQFSDSEKQWRLAAALYKRGANAEGLIEELPELKLEEVKSVIKSRRIAARKIIQNSTDRSGKGVPIDNWNEFLNNCEKVEGTSKIIPNSLYLKKRKRVAKNIFANRYTHLIGKSFTYAAFFEEHYRGKTSDDPDYSEIYRYLGQLLNGEEPTQLRPGSATKILDMLSLMKEVMDDKQTSDTYKNIIKRIFPSYLESEKNCVEEAIDRMKNNGGVKSEANCPLYQGDNDVDLCLSDVDEDSQGTYNIIRKISDKQVENGSYLLTVPGFNPLEMDSSCVSKPSVSLMLAERRFKKIKKS